MAEITTAGVPNLECRHTLGVSDANPRDVKLVSGKKYNNSKFGVPQRLSRSNFDQLRLGCQRSTIGLTEGCQSRTTE